MRKFDAFTLLLIFFTLVIGSIPLLGGCTKAPSISRNSEIETLDHPRGQLVIARDSWGDIVDIEFAPDGDFTNSKEKQ